ncbi:hypothetical protein [Demequina subtropica]|uniref:hypothetical protein n=1 Tax=Demequina subtropica TaxID=1638989 RepID=UPI000785F3D1|nr:hypothetical protein [Demequina subtropica]
MSAGARRRENLWALDVTVLAWRRTTFQVALAGLAVARMLETRVGWWVLASAVVAIALTFAVHASVSEYVSAIDERGHLVREPGGIGHPLVRQALVAGGTALLAAAALAWVTMQV